MIEELEGLSKGTANQAFALQELKALQKELRSASDEARLVTMTEPPTSGPTRSPNTLTATQAAIEANARLNALDMKTIVSTLRVIGTVLETFASGSDGCESSSESDDSSPNWKYADW